MASVHTLGDPATGTALARLRDAATGMAAFRAAATSVGSLLAAHCAALLPHVPGEVQTPLGPAPTSTMPAVVAVPVLRAGLGLLSGVLTVFPDAAIGMIGLQRDEKTLQAQQYYRNVPPLAGHHLLVLEPMLATGGSATDALSLLPGAESVTVLSVVATPVALQRIHATHPHATIVTAAIDPGLDDNGFIVPGLGDFGDRLWGT